MANTAGKHDSLNSISDKINLDTVKEYFSYNTVVQLLIFGFIGFIIGFLVKKFGRYFIFTFIVGGLALYLMHHFNIATLDVVRIKELLGLSEHEAFTSLFHTWYEWIKINVDLSLSILIGLIIGYKVG